MHFCGMPGETGFLLFVKTIYCCPCCINPKALNDFRPVALTSPVRKVFEKVMKQLIQVQVQGSLDPMLFGCSVGRGIEDICTTTWRAPCPTLDFFLLIYSLLLNLYSHIGLLRLRQLYLSFSIQRCVLCVCELRNFSKNLKLI